MFLRKGGHEVSLRTPTQYRDALLPGVIEKMIQNIPRIRHLRVDLHHLADADGIRVIQIPSHHVLLFRAQNNLPQAPIAS